MKERERGAVLNCSGVCMRCEGRGGERGRKKEWRERRERKGKQK